MVTTNNNTVNNANNQTKSNSKVTITRKPKPNSTKTRSNSNQDVRHEPEGDWNVTADSAGVCICDQTVKPSKVEEGSKESEQHIGLDERVQRKDDNSVHPNTIEGTANLISSANDEKSTSVSESTQEITGEFQDEERISSNATDQEVNKPKSVEDISATASADEALLGKEASHYTTHFSSDDKRTFKMLQDTVMLKVRGTYHTTFVELSTSYSLSGYDVLRHSPNKLSIDYEIPIYLMTLSMYDIYIAAHQSAFPAPNSHDLIFEMSECVRNAEECSGSEFSKLKHEFYREYWNVAYANRLTDLNCTNWTDFSKYDEKDSALSERFNRLRSIVNVAKCVTHASRILMWDRARKINAIANFITWEWFCKIGNFSTDSDTGPFVLRTHPDCYKREEEPFSRVRRRHEISKTTNCNETNSQSQTQTTQPTQQATDAVDDSGGIGQSYCYGVDDDTVRGIRRTGWNLLSDAFGDLMMEDQPQSPDKTVVKQSEVDKLVAAQVLSQTDAFKLQILKDVDLDKHIKTIRNIRELETAATQSCDTRSDDVLDGITYENSDGIVKIKENICDTIAVDHKIAISECDVFLVFYYQFKDKYKRGGMCALNKAHYLSLLSRGFGNRDEATQLSMLQFTTAYPYKLPTMFIRMIATPTMRRVLNIIMDGTSEKRFTIEKHRPVDSDFDASGIVTSTELLMRAGAEEPVNCYKIVSNGDKSPIMFKRDFRNTKLMVYKRMTPHLRFNPASFSGKFVNFLKKMSGNLHYNIKGDDFIDYARDRCEAKMLSTGERIEWMANAMCAKELFETNRPGLYSLYAFSLFRLTKCFIKDECYDKTTTTLRNIISPSTFVKVVYGTIFRPYEDYIYYHSAISKHLIKKMNDRAVHDKLSTLKQGADWVYGQYDSKAFESSYSSSMLQALYGELARVQDNAVCRNIINMTCTWNINPKIIRSKFFSVIYEDGQMSGFAHTSCWNVLTNTGDKVINCGISIERDMFLAEGDDFVICGPRAKVQRIAELSIFETTVLISEQFSELSFCGHHYLEDGTRIPDGNLYDKLNAFWCHHEPTIQELFDVGVMKALSYSLYYPGHPILEQFIDDFNCVYGPMNLKLSRAGYEDFLKKQWWRIEQRSFPVFEYRDITAIPRISNRVEDYIVKDQLLSLDSKECCLRMTTFIDEARACDTSFISRAIRDMTKTSLVCAAVGALGSAVINVVSGNRNIGGVVADAVSTAAKAAVIGSLAGFCYQSVKTVTTKTVGVNDCDVIMPAEVVDRALQDGMISSVESPPSESAILSKVQKYVKHYWGVRRQLENRLAKAISKLNSRKAKLLMSTSQKDISEYETWPYISEYLWEGRAIKKKVGRRRSSGYEI